MEKQQHSFFDIESPLETTFKKSLNDISEKYYPGTLTKTKEKYPDLWDEIKKVEGEMEMLWIPWNEKFEEFKALINEAIAICRMEDTAPKDNAA